MSRSTTIRQDQISPLFVSPLDRKRPIVPQMTAALIAIRILRGVCRDTDLLRLGFTPADIARHGGAARIEAVKQRPDLASEHDRRHAANVLGRA